MYMRIDIEVMAEEIRRRHRRLRAYRPSLVPGPARPRPAIIDIVTEALRRLLGGSAAH